MKSSPAYPSKLVDVTFLNPAFIAEHIERLEDDLKKAVIRICGYICYQFVRFNGHKDNKLHLYSKTMQDIAPQYRKALNVLEQIDGFFNHKSGYLPPKDGNKGISRFYLMGNKFLDSIRNHNVTKHAGKLKMFLRTDKSEKRVAERMEESKFIDAYCAHVEQSMKRAKLEIDAAIIEAYQPKKADADAGLSRLSIVESVNAFNSGKYRVSRSENVKKITHALSGIPAELRKLTIDGEETVEMDIKSSHVYLLLDHGFLTHWKESSKVNALLKTGDFWSSLKKEIPLFRHVERNDFKILFWKALSNGHVCREDQAKVEVLRQYLSWQFPVLLSKVREEESKQGKKIQAILQTHESALMDRFIAHCIEKDNAPCIPIYDSVIIKLTDAHLAYEFFGLSRVKSK